MKLTLTILLGIASIALLCIILIYRSGGGTVQSLPTSSRPVRGDFVNQGSRLNLLEFSSTEPGAEVGAGAALSNLPASFDSPAASDSGSF